MPVLIAAVAALGLAIGSFLNVVIYRLPRRESLMRPGSKCPGCDQPIRKRHNLPIIGWLMLRGRCADCKAHISIRYPLVELLTAALFVAVTLRVARLHLVAALPAYLFFVAIGIALTMIDIEVRRLPDSIVLPSYLVVALLLTFAALLRNDPSSLLRAVAGAASMFFCYFALAFAYPKGMGFGDVKLAGVIGAVLGFLSYPALIVGAFAAFVIGGFAGALAIVSGRGSGKTALPFGPFMIGGALLALFASAVLSTGYTRLVFRA